MAQKKVKNPCLRLYNNCTSLFIKDSLFLTLKCKLVHKCFVALFWVFTQRRLVVSCRRFRTTVGGCEILTAVLVKIQVIWDVVSCRLVNLPSSLGPAAQVEGTPFHRNVRNPSPVDRA